MKSRTIFILFLVLSLFLFVGWRANSYFRLKKIRTENRLENNPSQKALTLIINDGTNTYHSSFDYRQGMTVFDLLKEATAKFKLVLKIKQYETGILVESIGGVKNGQDKKYWLYYVNGKMPMVSVDKNKLNPGDKVEFKFAPSPF